MQVKKIGISSISKFLMGIIIIENQGECNSIMQILNILRKKETTYYFSKKFKAHMGRKKSIVFYL